MMRPMTLGMGMNMNKMAAGKMKLSWAELRERRRNMARRQRKREERRSQRMKRRRWYQQAIDQPRPQRVNNFIYVINYGSDDDSTQDDWSTNITDHKG